MISNEQKHKIINEYLENGITQSEIAKKFQISLTIVNRILKKQGVGRRQYRRRLLDEDKIVFLYLEKRLSVSKIIKFLGIKSLHPVSSILRERGLIRNNSERHIGQKAWNKGKPMSELQRKKLSIARMGRFTGKDNSNWRNGRRIFNSNDPKRKVFGYAEWRKKIKERDGWKCLECGEAERRKLHSHHIVSVRDIKDIGLLTEMSNGITLCKKCHWKTYGQEKKFELFYRALLQKAVNSGEVLPSNVEDNPDPSSTGQR